MPKPEVLEFTTKTRLSKKKEVTPEPKVLGFTTKTRLSKKKEVMNW